jgi:cytochrome-b5 reductase
LAHKENISHDTRRFRFQLPSSKHILGLPVGQHIYLTAHINGELVKRPYTPTTSDDNQGYFDLVIKTYPNGKMTQYLDKLPIGHTIDVSGPSGNLMYKDNGLFDIRTRKPEPYVTRHVRHLGLIAGGSGITPMYQILNEILKEQTSIVPGERVDIKIWLLFANQTEQDILLRDELEQLAASNSDRFRLWYTVDRESDDWKYSKGFISEDMLKEHMPPPSDDVLICICGPPPMIKFACIPNLDKLGYTENMRYTF